MKLLTALLPFLAVLALTACGITYMGGGRSFATADEAMAAGRSLTDELVANVEPLPSPIGGPVVIVLPTRDHAERVARLEFPNIEEELIKFLADGSVLDWRVDARLIERRNIFEEVRIVLAETPEGVDVPPNGYLIWIEGRSFRTRFRHIVAAGKRQTTEIKAETGGARDNIEKMRRLFDAIEEFVKTHRPAG